MQGLNLGEIVRLFLFFVFLLQIWLFAEGGLDSLLIDLDQTILRMKFIKQERGPDP